MIKQDNLFFEPPTQLDGAEVIQWAWSGDEPFGFVSIDDEKEMIYGLAICSYEDSTGIYRFSCNKGWEVIQDGFYGTIEQAITQLPLQYRNKEVRWYKR